MQKLVLFGGIVASALGAVIAVQGCAASSCQDTDTCAVGTDGSTDVLVGDRVVTGDAPDAKHPREGGKDAGDGATNEAAPDGEAGPGCKSGAPPADNGCVNDSSGVFVSTGGADSAGHGTMEKPFNTITYALAHLGSGPAVVYICGNGGGFGDQITVSSAVSIYGGLSCTSTPWVYLASAVAMVSGSSADFTLKIDAGTAKVDVEDMAFIAPAGSTPGQSSIAVLVNASTKVEFHRVVMTSGGGANGATGAAGDNGTTGAAPSGGNAMGSTGGTAPTCACGSSAGVGGLGSATGGTPGGNGGPSVSGGTGGDGLGGIYGSPIVAACNNGHNGATAPGQAGGAGQDAGGALTNSGWDGGAGASGTTGGEAQGGGGGSGGLFALTTAGGGSSGGCGGCGGGAGTGGGAGGASFALASVASTVTLDACTLTAGNGGDGGQGGAGQVGQAGGLAGTPSPPGCSGGTGGTGGQAGGGGGGAGGYSVAIAYTMTAPVMKNMTTAMASKGGNPGPAGTGGAPAPTPGSMGIAMPTLGF